MREIHFYRCILYLSDGVIPEQSMICSAIIRAL